jgi:Ni,Fe-hydrogenase III large subunit/Ni,Fe-hydrogenase III component G
VPAPDRTIHDVGPEELPAHAGRLLDGGHRLALVAAHHDDADAPGGRAVRVVYLFVTGPPDTRTELHVRLDPARPHVPTLARLSFPAGRFEREMRDLHGIVPVGHPLPRRLVRHFHWPRGWYPMHPDAGPPPPFAEPEGPYPFLEVEGDGVYEIPVGPVHAGLIEPGHFRFSVVGETIIKLKARLWFVHKGIEQLFAGRSVAGGLPLAERISGDTAVGHALAYCLAVEDATATEVPEQARRARALLLELERVHNHVADLGALCNDVGSSLLNAHAQRVREHLLRLNQEITGHRLLRGGVLPGGATLRSLPDPARIQALRTDIRDIAGLALGHTTVRDRFTGTARLSTTAARDLGCLGYVARASAIAADARVAHPFVDHGIHLAATVPGPGTYAVPLVPDRARGSRPGTRSGVGIVEGWRGTLTTRVELGPGHILTRVKPVDPSFFNWPALPVALDATIVPDFPLANKSFNLSYAGNDL